jgi:nitrate/TMAO reductase-like tetraheme cytochrome c subunit
VTPDPAVTQAEHPRRISRVVLWVGVALVAVLVVAVAVAVYLTSRPAFFAGYPRLARSYAAMQTSAHKDLRCEQCHVSEQPAVVTEAALVAEFYRGLVNRPREPVFVKLPTPTRAACRACHEYDWSDEATRTMKVPHPAHLRVATETRDCVVCHKWTAHEETYMQKHTAMPFSTVCASFECHVGVKPANDCKNCHHVLQESLGAWKVIHPKTVRANGPNGCLERCHTADQCRLCHTTGQTPVFASTISQPGVKAIEQQHVLPDWIAKHGTMALADQSKCLICHVSEGECQDCHSKRPAFHGSTDTWLSAHQPLAKKNPQRCLTCHQQAVCDACHKKFKEMR